MRVLKFGAIWCPSCLIMRPRWQEIEKENPWLKNEYFDFDENKDIVEKYQIGESLPVFTKSINRERNRVRGSGFIYAKKYCMRIIRIFMFKQEKNGGGLLLSDRKSVV